MKDYPFGVFNPDFTFRMFLQKWCGLKGDFYTKEYHIFWKWYQDHGKDYDAEIPKGLDASRLKWNESSNDWEYEFPDGFGVTEEGHTAWQKAIELAEDLERLGVIEDAMDIINGYCDIALEEI